METKEENKTSKNIFQLLYNKQEIENAINQLKLSVTDLSDNVKDGIKNLKLLAKSSASDLTKIEDIENRVKKLEDK